MSILDNELVKKYFGCKSDCAWLANYPHPENEHMALGILKAMEEPIKKGEKILLQTLDSWELLEAGSKHEGYLRSSILRLPDQFQPERCCDNGFFDSPHTCQKQPSRELPGCPNCAPCKKPDPEKCEFDRYFCEQCRRDCKCTSRGYPENPEPLDKEITRILSTRGFDNIVSELVELFRKRAAG